jgi:putative ABC transport system permease protein
VNLLVLSLHRTADTERIAGMLRKRGASKGLTAKTWEDLNDFYRSTVDLYERQFGVLQLIILLMVLLGVVNAINMSVFERVGEFGTMRALGNQRRQVFRLVVLEGTLLGLIGAAMGVALGIGLAMAISAVGIPMPPPPNSSQGYTAYIRIVPSIVAGGFLIGVAASALASVVPAFRISRIPIADALRQNA